ncbi:methionyl-tRNA formyltransferase [Limnospira fusiformis]|uniref:methionyl-tRNA formyltransferase n=1 Tax=Limnospira fusiformis TaxID=54297 RepID=UPI0034E0A6C6
MKIAFFGNHTVGVEVLSTLMELTRVVGVVAHPPDPEDGHRYQSVYEFSQQNKLTVIRGKPSDLEIFSFIEGAEPDLIWVTDYRYLLPPRFLQIAPLGAINLHPSLLPKYRGRASINWAIINGESELGLTAHFIDEGIDSGDIILQEKFELKPDEDIQDALTKLMPLYRSVTRQVIQYFQLGSVPRYPQNESLAISFPSRKPKDGKIDWGQSAEKVCNLIRAVTYPYPGAFSFLRGTKVLIWKATVVKSQTVQIPGTVLAFKGDSPIVMCGHDALVLEQFELVEQDTAKILFEDKLG